MFKKLKNNKGFTLVELIVVLVILAILAALLVPALTGYIDKARNESIIAETRSAVVAAQTIVSEDYGHGKNIEASDYVASVKDEIKKLAEAPGTIDSFDVYTAAEAKTATDTSVVAGKIKTLTYKSKDNKKQCVYTYNSANTDPYDVSDVGSGSGNAGGNTQPGGTSN